MLFEHRVNFDLKKGCSALLVTDMQNDFLTPGGKYYVMIEELMKRNNVNSNLESLLQAAELGVASVQEYLEKHAERKHVA